MMHDFNVTRNYTIFMDSPIVFDMDLAMAGGMPFVFRPENGARLGVLPRQGTNADVTWFDVDPCYVFPPVNSYETGDRIVIDVARYPKLWAQDQDFADSATLWRWQIDLGSGLVAETQLDDKHVEFGRVADAKVAEPYRYGYLVGSTTSRDQQGSVVKHDLEQGNSTTHNFGAEARPGEFVFTPRQGATAEDDGYLLGYVYNQPEDRSDLVILDAADIAAHPIATIALPRRVPFGFHGSWVADR